MRPNLLLSLFALLALVRHGVGQEKKYPEAGSDLPGTFHPYNVTGQYGEAPDPKEKGKELRGKYHCPVSDTNLDPGVLVFLKVEIDPGAEVKDLLQKLSPAARELLQKLDTAVAKNPAVRLRVHAIFFSNALPEVVGESDATDDLRDKFAAALRRLAEDLKLEHVVLCIDGRDDLKSYVLDNKADVTLVGFRKFTVAFDVYTLAVAQLPDKLKPILTDLAEKLGVRRQ